MKNAISFFFETKLYKGRITYQRVKEIIESYGFTLIEYDLTADDEIVEILRSFSLLGHAAAYDCFTHVVDTHHKYVFLKSGNAARSRTYIRGAFYIKRAGTSYKHYKRTKGKSVFFCHAVSEPYVQSPSLLSGAGCPDGHPFYTNLFYRLPGRRHARYRLLYRRRRGVSLI